MRLPFAPPGQTVRALYRTGHSTTDAADIFGQSEAAIWNALIRRPDMAPFCRYCGDLIPKKTTLHWFGTTSRINVGSVRHHTERPTCRGDAQRLVEDRVLSVRYGLDARGQRFVTQVSTWDGQSHVDEHFCKPGHATLFARALAEQGAMSDACAAAEARRQAQLLGRTISSVMIDPLARRSA